jgi:lysyl-tRNA synthetase, class I
LNLNSTRVPSKSNKTALNFGFDEIGMVSTKLTSKLIHPILSDTKRMTEEELKGEEEAPYLEEDSSSSLIGRGTWLDRVAAEVIEREKKLGRELKNIRVESGLGASGIPHIGSLGDAARAYGVKLALEEAGYRSELIAYSDDMDALRKVPAGLPEWLKNDIAKPVSEIKDPFDDGHPSYGAHMSALLLQGLDALGLHYRFQSGYESYKQGLLAKEIDLILKNAELIGSKIEELTGQQKYLETLPYFPQCSNCHRLNVAHAVRYDPKEMKVYYKCTGDKIGKKWVEGCGNEGVTDIRKGEGKLSWKVEFAARWAALDVRFEAHGKELRDSVKINDWICDNILQFPHPYHVVYELFQDKSGKKISKSVGNLVSPQKWLSLASPQSLLLVYYKRIIGARNISEEDVPAYMDEYDYYEDVYFGKVKEPNKMKEARLKGIYYYANLANPPPSPSQHVPYRMLVELSSVAPSENAEDYVAKRLIEYKAVREITEEVRQRIRYALNWAKEFTLQEGQVHLTTKQREAVLDLSNRIEIVSDPQTIQTLIFDIARSHGVEPSDFFGVLYRILLGIQRGPRLGPYIVDLGPNKVAKKLKDAVELTVKP